MNIPDYQIRVLEKEKITCKDVRGLLDDYVDDQLTESLKLRIDEHVCSCKYCQDLKDGYLLTIKLAKKLRDAPKPPKGVQSRLRAALNERLGLNLTIQDE